MDPTTTRTLGRNGIEVTQLVGDCAPFGSVSRQVPEAEVLTVRRLEGNMPAATTLHEGGDSS